jgi:hypothetical protein
MRLVVFDLFLELFLISIAKLWQLLTESPFRLRITAIGASTARAQADSIVGNND